MEGPLLPYEPIRSERPCPPAEWRPSRKKRRRKPPPRKRRRSRIGGRIGRGLALLTLSASLLVGSAQLSSVPTVKTAAVFDFFARQLAAMRAPRDTVTPPSAAVASASNAEPVICNGAEAAGMGCSDGRVAKVDPSITRATAQPEARTADDGPAAMPAKDRAAEWAKSKADALAAEVCAAAPPPRLGCPDAPKAVARPVETAQISDTELVNVAENLQGTWRDSNYTLRVDVNRAQANVDGPLFDWQGFRVREVSGDEIVFAVGWQIYTAKISNSSLVLTSTSFRGEKTLTRTPSG